MKRSPANLQKAQKQGQLYVIYGAEADDHTLQRQCASNAGMMNDRKGHLPADTTGRQGIPDCRCIRNCLLQQIVMQGNYSEKAVFL